MTDATDRHPSDDRSTDPDPSDIDPGRSPELRMPSRYGFLRESRWIGLIAAMLVVSLGCVLLGIWQWNRHEARSAFAARIEAAWEAPAQPLADALGDPPAAVTGASEWQTVELEGSYLPDHQVMLRARPVDGTPAVHVLTPFLATSSAGEPVEPMLVFVDRGWLPAAVGDEIVRGEAPMPAPPQGRVELGARLRIAEEPDARAPSPGIVLRIDPAQVLDAAGLTASEAGAARVLDGYAQAATEATGGAPITHGADQPTAYVRPSTQLGNNLSYAFQWWFFAVGAQVAWILLARREADEREEELLLGFLPGERPGDTHGAGRGTAWHLPAGEAASSVRRRPRARTEDDDAEDAAVDAALR